MVADLFSLGGVQTAPPMGGNREVSSSRDFVDVCLYERHVELEILPMRWSFWVVLCFLWMGLLVGCKQTHREGIEKLCDSIKLSGVKEQSWHTPAQMRLLNDWILQHVTNPEARKTYLMVEHVTVDNRLLYFNKAAKEVGLSRCPIGEHFAALSRKHAKQPNRAISPAKR
jgi:hypothetical protein